MAESVTTSQQRFVSKARRKEPASVGVRSQRCKPGSSPVTRCTVNTRCKRGGNGQASKGGADPSDGRVRGGGKGRRGRFVHDPPDKQFWSLLFRVSKILPAV